MTNAEIFANRLSRQLPHVKRGTLRIWGEWFGRPYDNIHTIIAAVARGDTLILSFDQGETLTIESPGKATFDQYTFRINVASRVHWEWFYYGRERLPENLQYLDYVLGPEGSTLNTNWRFRRPPNQPPAGPAAELV
ncbi:hypothetical protein [Acidisphaera sp. S103]|uniref:hypothetical protein n=1 Tax=Acidisphaera sp. S103 TaxID=1747223 RepID=UPI00131D5746|nr:hypothetical protein [Acidisphaera sp. S103]